MKSLQLLEQLEFHDKNPGSTGIQGVSKESKIR